MRTMRNIINILIILLFISCQPKKPDGIWFSPDWLNNPSIVEISGNKLLRTSNDSMIDDLFKIKILDSIVIMEDIRATSPDIDLLVDTHSYFYNGSDLRIGDINLIKLEKSSHFLDDFLPYYYNNIQIPRIDFPNKIDYPASDFIIIPKQGGDSLQIVINGMWIATLSDILKYINYDMFDMRNKVRFFVDKDVSYSTINEVRNYLRYLSIFKAEFVYRLTDSSPSNYFATDGLFIRSHIMMENGKEFFKTKLDTSIDIPPLPPSPPPYQPDDFLRISVLDSSTIKVEEDIFDFESSMVDKIIFVNMLNKVFVLDVSDSVDFETYIKSRLKFVENEQRFRNIVSENIYGKKFTDLDYEIQDSLNDIYHFRLFEISQYLDVERDNLESKYGL